MKVYKAIKKLQYNRMVGFILDLEIRRELVLEGDPHWLSDKPMLQKLFGASLQKCFEFASPWSGK